MPTVIHTHGFCKPPRSGGIEKLIADASAVVAEQVEAWHATDGTTEIERLLFAALLVRGKVRLVPSVDGDLAKVLENSLDPYAHSRILISPQHQLPGWRVDFLVKAYGLGARRWRHLIVEADGHDFHERTKEQAALDRSRDRWAQLNGYAVMRFTGSEIWTDAWGCAGQVFQWADEGRE